MQTDLCCAFNTYFELVHADTEALRAQVFQLRYQIYVLETGFERPDGGAARMDEHGQPIHWESDVYDERSDHYLLRHRRTGLYAATTRLILPQPGQIDAPYPIELHCKLDERVEEAALRAHLGEISRFAVSKAFKRRFGEAGSIAGVATNIDAYFLQNERRVLPHLSLGLFAAILRMAHSHAISHCYAVMEPALVRLLERFGVILRRIGPDSEYHGLRVPCLTTAAESLPSIQRVAPQVWEFITDRGELLK